MALGFISILSFQNCTPGFKDQGLLDVNINPPQLRLTPNNSSSTSTSDSGNGGVYGGLQMVMPKTVEAGKTYGITVIGGLAPFKIQSQNNIGEFTQVNDRQFNWTIPNLTSAQADEIVLFDTNHSKISNTVTIKIYNSQVPHSNFGIGSFKNQVVTLKNFVISNSSKSYLAPEEEEEPVYRKIGFLQVFEKNGNPSKVLYHPNKQLRQDDSFGMGISASKDRLIVSSNKIIPNKVHAEAVIYAVDDQGNFTPEQTIVSTRPSYWNWADVGISGDIAFLHYQISTRYQDDSFIEFYQRGKDNVWRLFSTLDFSKGQQIEKVLFSPIISMRNSAIGAIRFSETDSTLIVASETSKEQFLRVWRIQPDNTWKSMEKINIQLQATGYDFILDLMTSGLRDNRLLVTIAGGKTGENNLYSHTILFIKNENTLEWELRQIITGPENGKSVINEVSKASLGKDYLILSNSTSSMLAVYNLNKQGSYELFSDLSPTMRGAGMSAQAIMIENTIFVSTFFEVLSISLPNPVLAVK